MRDYDENTIVKCWWCEEEFDVEYDDLYEDANNENDVLCEHCYCYLKSRGDKLRSYRRIMI